MEENELQVNGNGNEDRLVYPLSVKLGRVSERETDWCTEPEDEVSEWQ